MPEGITIFSKGNIVTFEPNSKGSLPGPSKRIEGSIVEVKKNEDNGTLDIVIEEGDGSRSSFNSNTSIRGIKFP